MTPMLVMDQRTSLPPATRHAPCYRHAARRVVLHLLTRGLTTAKLKPASGSYTFFFASSVSAVRVGAISPFSFDFGVWVFVFHTASLSLDDDDDEGKGGTSCVFAIGVVYHHTIAHQNG